MTVSFKENKEEKKGAGKMEAIKVVDFIDIRRENVYIGIGKKR